MFGDPRIPQTALWRAIYLISWLSAPVVMSARLLTGHPLAVSWARMIEAAGPRLRKGYDAWALYPIGESRPAAAAVPPIPRFTVYAVPAGPDWLYVGQTRQPLRAGLAARNRTLHDAGQND